MRCKRNSERSRAPRSHLRPDLRHRKGAVAASGARWWTRPNAWSSTSWCAKGCGDCGVQSNCRRWSRWRPSSAASAPSTRTMACNTTHPCVKGFCPFHHGRGWPLAEEGQEGCHRRMDRRRCARALLPTLGSEAWGVIVAGVGGTGSSPSASCSAWPAHLEGKGIVTQDAAGLAQKGGATWSHVLIGAQQDDIRTTRVASASADLIIGCDPIVSANKETWQRLRAGRTHVALNVSATPTAAFVKNPDWQNPAQACVDALVHSLGAESGGRVRRRNRRHPPDGRQPVHQPHDAGLRLAKGLAAAGAGIADACDRAQRRAGGQEQGGLRVGPPRRAQPAGRGRAVAEGRRR